CLLGQNIQQVLNALQELTVFGSNLVNFQAGQLVEAHFQDLVGLQFAERVAATRQPRFAANQNAKLLHLRAREIKGHQLDLRFLAIGRMADDTNKLIEVGQRDEVTLQFFGPLFRFAQLKFRAADDYFPAVLDVTANQLL